MDNVTTRFLAKHISVAAQLVRIVWFFYRIRLLFPLLFFIVFDVFDEHAAINMTSSLRLQTITAHYVSKGVFDFSGLQKGKEFE